MFGTQWSAPTSRREFLRVGVSALGGMTLADLLAYQAQAARRPAQTSVILVWMGGAPSQFETWDPKPDAPSEYRGPLRAIRTNIVGTQICELFPKLAERAHRYSIIRSLHTPTTLHTDGAVAMLTGRMPSQPDKFGENPDFGTVTAWVRGGNESHLPSYIGIPRPSYMTGPAYLGQRYAGFSAGEPWKANYRPKDIVRSDWLSLSRLGERRQLMQSLDHYRRSQERQREMQALDSFQSQAFDLLTSPNSAKAFAIDEESPALREQYGNHQWGQSFLLARRLAEAGVPVVTVNALSPKEPPLGIGHKIYTSWDDHPNAQPGWDLQDAMRWRAPYFDQAFAALVDDVFERGLNEKILIVAIGEFGRTPMYTVLRGFWGRDHWNSSQSALLAGGGLRMGQVVGATNAHGEHPVTSPLTHCDVLATIYHHLGVDYTATMRDYSGRPLPILPSGSPIDELI